MYRHISPEERVRANHPLRAIRAMADEALVVMSVATKLGADSRDLVTAKTDG